MNALEDTKLEQGLEDKSVTGTVVGGGRWRGIMRTMGLDKNRGGLWGGNDDRKVAKHYLFSRMNEVVVGETDDGSLEMEGGLQILIVILQDLHSCLH